MATQDTPEPSRLKPGLTLYAKFAWGVLAYNIGVILWGAYVRATGSGAGCGNHWPLCDAQVIPQSPRIQTLIEFSHRVSSGLTLILIAGLAVWAFRSYPAGHRVRTGAAFGVLLTITEALVGAGLVLFQLVAGNTSMLRAVVIALHLVTTLFLLAALTLTAFWASGGKSLDLRAHPEALTRLGLALLGVLIIGMTGAITALGDTLFPAGSLAQGLEQDAAPTAQFLIRLRIYHPLVAIIVGAYLIWIVRYHFTNLSLAASRGGAVITALVILQWVAGLANVILLAPVWLQMLHLLIADLMWIALILFSCVILGNAEPQTVSSPRLPIAENRPTG